MNNSELTPREALLFNSFAEQLTRQIGEQIAQANLAIRALAYAMAEQPGFDRAAFAESLRAQERLMGPEDATAANVLRTIVVQMEGSEPPPL